MFRQTVNPLTSSAATPPQSRRCWSACNCSTTCSDFWGDESAGANRSVAVVPL